MTATAAQISDYLAKHSDGSFGIQGVDTRYETRDEAIADIPFYVAQDAAWVEAAASAPQPVRKRYSTKARDLRIAAGAPIYD